MNFCLWSRKRILRFSWAVFTLVTPACPGGRAETFRKSEVKLVGPIDYGETSLDVRAIGRPSFYAFAFNAKPGDPIEVTVHVQSGSVKAYLANAKWESLAGGSAQFQTIIPSASEPATYYVVVDTAGKPSRFKVELERPSYSQCHVDADCITVPKEGCCHNGYKEAVNRNQIDAYRAANACQDRHTMCPQFIINDTRVARCNKAAGRCELTQQQNIR